MFRHVADAFDFAPVGALIVPPSTRCDVGQVVAVTTMESGETNFRHRQCVLERDHEGPHLVESKRP